MNALMKEEKDTFYDGFAFQKRVTVKDEIYITQHDIHCRLICNDALLLENHHTRQRTFEAYGDAENGNSF